MFCGDHRFLDTCTGNWNLSSPPSLLLDISRSEQQSPINLAGEEGQKIIQSTGNKFTVPLDLRNVNELASDKDIEHETDSEDQKAEENHEKDSENQKMDIEDNKVDSGDQKADDNHEKDSENQNMEKTDDQKMDIEDHKVDSADQKAEENHGKDTDDQKMDIEDNKVDSGDQKVDENHEKDSKKAIRRWNQMITRCILRIRGWILKIQNRIRKWKWIQKRILCQMKWI